MKNLYSIVVLSVSALLAACTTNPMTGRSQLMLVSEQSAIAQSVSAYNQMVGELDKNGKISRNQVLISRINDITNRLITQAVRYRPETQKWSWSMEVIDDPKTINAFCMAGGKMAIFTGLTEKIQPTDDELAQVVGHEISHALASHSAEKMSVKLAADLAVAVTAAAAGRNNNERRGLYNAGALATMAIITLPNSRQAESEADKLGIELAARAGYDPHAAVTLWEKMMREGKNSSRGDFFSTHPSAPNRIDALSALAAPMQEIYDTNRQNREQQPYAWLGSSRNEHVVSGGPLRPAVQPALVFYSPEFDAFQKGTAVLTCGGECSVTFLIKQTGLRSEYEKKNWRMLAMETVKSNYKLDLTYFYLAKAADGLGFLKSAQRYYREAHQLSQSEDFACAKKVIVGCAGNDIAKLSTEALRTDANAEAEQQPVEAVAVEQ